MFKIIVILSLLVLPLAAQFHPDQHYVRTTTELWERIEYNEDIVLSADGKHLQLVDDDNYGYVVFLPDTSTSPFDRGLPSWNGMAFEDDSGFKVEMRFPWNAGWSPWLTVGYWQDYIWSSYGSTSYSGGEIDYDYVVLENFTSVWQFRVQFKRSAANDPSPLLDKLSFFVSDQRTTDNADFVEILNDDPPEIFIPTTFVCQYNVDPDIGGSICSPTSTCLALRSYDIEVDALDFAQDNYDSYWGLFGIWPRAVQNAAEFGVDGAVTRYRTWSEAYDTLAAGGRVVMSVGPPLYSGHLMMLAGFDDDGDPIVHDPARQNGYAYMFNKYSLGVSWFDKGGVGYTFFNEEDIAVSSDPGEVYVATPGGFHLYEAYPNPFNPLTRISFSLESSEIVELSVHDHRGRLVETLAAGEYPAGQHELAWNAGQLPTGSYLVSLKVNGVVQVIRTTLLK